MIKKFSSDPDHRQLQPFSKGSCLPKINVCTTWVKIRHTSILAVDTEASGKQGAIQNPLHKQPSSVDTPKTLRAKGIKCLAISSSAVPRPYPRISYVAVSTKAWAKSASLFVAGVPKQNGTNMRWFYFLWCCFLGSVVLPQHFNIHYIIYPFLHKYLWIFSYSLVLSGHKSESLPSVTPWLRCEKYYYPPFNEQGNGYSERLSDFPAWVLEKEKSPGFSVFQRCEFLFIHIPSKKTNLMTSLSTAL